MRITDKQQAHQLYMAGEFGNRTRTWTPEEFRADEHRPAFAALRTLSTPGIQPPQYSRPIEAANIMPMLDLWVASFKIPRRLIYVSEVTNGVINLPCGPLRLQGEVLDGPHGLELRASRSDQIMRYAWAEQEIHLRGAAALSALRWAMDSPSFENLKNIFEKWPGHVVEFSSFTHLLGTEGWNTVFWEVRDY